LAVWTRTRRRAILDAVMPPVFRILGPLEVELSMRVVALGRRERALLGVLLLNAGAVVSVERLIDGVWGESPPSSAKHMVHEYVSRLRTALGDSSRIQTRAPGYLADCTEDEVDARLFSRLVAIARAAVQADDRTQALHSYDQALALWRGDALAGVDARTASDGTWPRSTAWSRTPRRGCRSSTRGRPSWSPGAWAMFRRIPSGAC
jgi:hypothetical protein